MSGETINVTSTNPKTQKFFDLFDFDTESPYGFFNINEDISKWELRKVNFEKNYIRVPEEVLKEYIDGTHNVNKVEFRYDPHGSYAARVLKYGDRGDDDSEDDNNGYEIHFGKNAITGGTVERGRWDSNIDDNDWTAMTHVLTALQKKHKDKDIRMFRRWEQFQLISKDNMIIASFEPDFATITILGKWDVDIKPGRIDELHNIVKPLMDKWLESHEYLAHKIVTQVNAQELRVVARECQYDVENPRPLKRRRVK